MEYEPGFYWAIKNGHGDMIEIGDQGYVYEFSNASSLTDLVDYDSLQRVKLPDTASHAKVMADLTEAAANGDTEAAHMDADNSLVEFVQALGFDDVAEAYDKVRKWYA